MRFESFFRRVFPSEKEDEDDMHMYDNQDKKARKACAMASRVAVIRFLHTRTPVRDERGRSHAAVHRIDWSKRDICPIIKWFDDGNIPYVYSAWENYYRSNDAVWCISQHGHVRSYRACQRHTYECVASQNMMCRVTSELRRRDAEGLVRHPVFSSSELSLGYNQTRQHRVYRITDGVELHMCLHARRYTVWMDIDVLKFHRLALKSQKSVFSIIDRCSNHLRNCVDARHVTCTDAALSTLQRRFTGMLSPGDKGDGGGDRGQRTIRGGKRKTRNK